MKRKKGETFKQYKVRRTQEDLRLKEKLKGTFIHVSKRSCKKKEKGITYYKPKTQEKIE